MTGLGATSMSMAVTYDGAVLTPIGVTLGSVGNSNGGGRTLSITKPALGSIIVTLTGVNEFQGSGALVNLNFNVVGLPGTFSPVSFTTFQYNAGPPCGTTTNGSVTVIPGTISGTVTYGNAIVGPTLRNVPNVLLSGAGSPSVSTLTNAFGTYTLTGFGTGAYTVTPSKTGGDNGAVSAFDAAMIAQHVTGLTHLTGNQAIVADVSGNGNITSFDAGNIANFVVASSPSGNAGNWRFNPISRTYPAINTDIPGQDYSALLIGDVSGNWGDPSSFRSSGSSGPGRSASITLPQLVAPADNEVTIPVAVQGVANKGVISYEFELAYDPLVIQPQTDPVDLSGTVSSGLTAVTNSSDPGVLRVAVYGATGISSNGLLLNLRFNAIGAPGSVSALTWGRLMLNDGNPRVMAMDGQVELSAATPNQAEISGRLLTTGGQGVPNTRVTLTDAVGLSRSIVSNGFGMYRFGGLQVGQTYTISVDGRRNTFAPLTVSITGQLVNVDMIAEH